MVETLFKLATQAHALETLRTMTHKDSTCEICKILKETEKMLDKAESYGQDVVLYIP